MLQYSACPQRCFLQNVIKPSKQQQSTITDLQIKKAAKIPENRQKNSQPNNPSRSHPQTASQNPNHHRMSFLLQYVFKTLSWHKFLFSIIIGNRNWLPDSKFTTIFQILVNFWQLCLGSLAVGVGGVEFGGTGIFLMSVLFLYVSMQPIENRFIPFLVQHFTFRIMPNCIPVRWLLLPFMLVLCSMVTATLGSNLVCNGDFQAFVLTQPDSNKYQNLTSSKFSYINNNASCWYAQSKSYMEVKQFKVGGQLTQVADFISVSPYPICQDFTLKLNQPYDLNFCFIIDGAHSLSTLFCAVNSLTLYSIVSSSTITPSYGYLRLVPIQTNNKVCFSTVTVFKVGTSLFDMSVYGPVLDNVTLVEVVTNTSSNTSNTNTATNTATNTTTNTTNSAMPITTDTATPTPTAVTLPVQNIIIHVKTYWNPYSGMLYLYTDYRIADYDISFQFFIHCIVEINQEIQENTKFYLDVDGYLFVEAEPDVVYASEYIDNLKVYVPQEILAGLASTNITFYVDGNQIKLSQLSTSEQAVFNQAEPYILQITKTMKQAFAMLNMFYCSFFILGIIQFWNLALLYNFLPIQSVPKFAEAFFSKMINFFFTFNSLTTEINRIANKASPTQSLLDFTGLTTNEKILSVKDGHVWFAFSGMSSNFLDNNFDSLVLLSFFVLKCLLLKLLLRILKLKFANLSQVRTQMFLRQFSSEILCFTPFITISALSVFCYMGETNFLGKINNFLHVSMVFWIIAIPCLVLIKALKKIRKKTLTVKKHRKVKSWQEKAIKILLNFLIPVAVVINNIIGFFVVISLLLLWKIINFLINFKVYSWFGKLVKTITNISWVVYHLCFMTFFFFDNIKQGQSQQAKQIIKYVGFAAILCLLLGGLFDILKCLVDFLMSMVKLVIYLYHLCCTGQKDPSSALPSKNGKQNILRVDKIIPIYGSKKQKNAKIISLVPRKTKGKHGRNSSEDKSGKISKNQKKDPNNYRQKQTQKTPYLFDDTFANQFILVPVEKVPDTNSTRIQIKHKLASKVKRVRKDTRN